MRYVVEGCGSVCLELHLSQHGTNTGSETLSSLNIANVMDSFTSSEIDGLCRPLFENAERIVGIGILAGWNPSTPVTCSRSSKHHPSVHHLAGQKRLSVKSSSTKLARIAFWEMGNQCLRYGCLRIMVAKTIQLADGIQSSITRSILMRGTSSTTNAMPPCRREQIVE